MPNQRKAGTHRRTIAIPDELWMTAKATAARRGESLSQAIRRFLESYIRDTD